jgi:citrate synthase
LASVTTEKTASGLEGVIACDTSVCFIDGLADPSVLEYRGYNINDLAGTATFEEVAHLLLHGTLPTADELRDIDARLRGQRELPAEVARAIAGLPAAVSPISALRTVMSLLGGLDEEPPSSREVVLAQAIRTTALLPTIIAAQYRRSQGLDPVAPDPALAHAANYLYMLNGKPPTPNEARALDTMLILYAEHELNASTFTVRVTAGTMSDYYSAIVAGICALKGPLHGGAAEDALEVITAIGRAENVRPWVDAAFAEKRLISGFGHRVYKTGDARTPHLRAMCRALAADAADSSLVDTALGTEEYIRSRKNLVANVDFYAAAALVYLGFPGRLFTSFVTSSRILGWSAHALEQYDVNRVIRPRARYTGDRERAFTGLDQR